MADEQEGTLTQQGPTFESVDEKPTRKEWLLARKSGIGGSDCAAIFGKDLGGKTAVELYDEKIGEVPDDEGSPITELGKILEPYAIARYVKETGHSLTPRPMQRHPELGFMIANIDSEIADAVRGPGVFEAKTAGMRVYAKIRQSGLPMAYFLQMMHYLTVTGYNWGAFAVLDRNHGGFHHFEVERDPEWSAILIEHESAFWSAVENRKRPTVESIKLPDMPATATGDIVIRNDPEWAEVAGQLREAKDLTATAAEIEAAVRTRIKDLMGGYGVAEGSGLRVYHRQQPGRKTFDKAALAGAMPLDPILVAKAIFDVIGDEQHELRVRLQESLSGAKMDLSRFDKVGKPFDEMRPYFLKGEALEPDQTLPAPRLRLEKGKSDG